LKLLVKINLVLIVVFGLGFALIAKSAYDFLMGQAQQQVLAQAQLMGASASATKDYTDGEVSPVLEQTTQHSTNFLPQTVPFYAATATFKKLGSAYSDYTLRETVLNPMNLADRPADWEADIINYFRNHPKETSRTGQRATATGDALYVALPIVSDEGCLICHLEPDQAPKGLIKHYGRSNGFGWKANEIVGALIISVPMSVPIKIANDGFRNLLTGLGGILLATIILIDVALFFIVIRPLRKVREAADRISKGEVDLPQLDVKGKDEIAEVTESFNRMHTSLIKAFEMLNG
jgi:protein-histidine pros-kinase